MFYSSIVHVLADEAPPGLAQAGFDLQGAGHGLPHVGETLPDVQHRDVHEGHLDRAVGPQLHVVHGALIRLDVAAAEQLCGPETETQENMRKHRKKGFEKHSPMVPECIR